MHLSPPVVGQWIYRTIREMTGVEDPYAKLKHQFNEHAMRLRDAFGPTVIKAPDPLEAALRLSIAGNRIDFGASDHVCEQDITCLTHKALTQTLHGDIQLFKHEIAEAEHILFLADNTGEIALDMLLIEQMPREKLTVAVRGRSVINDATLADAHAVGLTKLVRVIDNGSDAPGTILDDCSSEFCDLFEQADLIISKGQGNYESLCDLRDRNIYFLLIPKCALVANHLNAPEGSFVMQSALENKS